jgi:hypothetical protein
MCRLEMDTRKKLRGIPRRMRALAKWAESFRNWFPSDEELNPDHGLRHWKLPVHQSLVEGRSTTPAIQRDCAQLLIDACGFLIANKPETAQSVRVTGIVCLPSMFASELCIFTSPTLYRDYVSERDNEFQTLARISGRSLASEWGLRLPPGVDELGIAEVIHRDESQWVGELWYFGEVLD